MKITNNFGMPQPFVDFAINDKYSKGKADISVTSLIDSPKVRIMKNVYDDDIEVDAVDMVWALFGTAVHSVLEQSSSSKNIINEERLYANHNGWIVSGALDRQEIKNDTVSIIDYKVTSVWSVIYGKPEWEKQLNCYSWLFRKNNTHNHLKIGSLKICAILRDWNRRDAERKESYPQAPIVFVDIPIWDENSIDAYISERVSLHQEAQVNYDLNSDLPLCSDQEMWKKDDAWAVKKKGQKRALRVLDSEEDAIKYMDWHKETDKAYVKNTDLELEFRGGEYTRCGNYCSVADFCNQYQERLK
jgi:predicted transglutaminase-like cysteine proteinase